MKTVFHLAWREIAARRRRVAVEVLLVAAATASCVAIEILSNARENAVAAEIDNAGPSFKVVSDVLLPDGTADRVRKVLGGRVRMIEERLVVSENLDGRPTTVAGIDPARTVTPHASLGSLPEGGVAAGKLLAERLRLRVGGAVHLAGRTLPVSAVLPESGTPEDLFLFVPLPWLRTARAAPQGSNEIRVFLRAGGDSGTAAADVQARVPGVTVARAERGGAVEHEADGALRRHRWAAYLATAAAAAGFLFMAALLNAKERGLEMALLLTMGGTAESVLGVISARAAVVGVAGAILGCFAGVAIALWHDPTAAAFAVRDPSRPLFVAALGVAVSMLSALPAAAHAAFRNPVTALQG